MPGVRAVIGATRSPKCGLALFSSSDTTVCLDGVDPPGSKVFKDGGDVSANDINFTGDSNTSMVTHAQQPGHRGSAGPRPPEFQGSMP